MPITQTQTKGTARNLIRIAAAIVLSLSVSPALNAQVIPAGAIPSHNVHPLMASRLHDVVTNTDMLEDPNGHIKAIVSSAVRGAGNNPLVPYPYILASDNGITVEDYNGNSWTTTLPPDCMQLDVALGNSRNPVTGNVDYQMLVTYVQFDPTMAPGYTHNAILEIFDLQDVGMPSIHAISRGPRPLSGSTGCYGFPHIDMWSDAGLPVNGFPSMHQFAVVWADQNGDGWYWEDDISTFPLSAPNKLLTTAGNTITMHMPDVACLTDIPTGNRYMEIAYGNGTPPTAYPGPVTVHSVYGLEYGEFDPATGTATPGMPVSLDSRQVYAPRIEAMSQYDAGTKIAKYQIAASVYPVTGSGLTQVMGYNDLVPAPTDFSSLLAPLYPSYTAMGACVAAGTGISINGGNIGNNQYTAGFFPWQYDAVYARGVDAGSGTLILPGQCHRINNFSEPVDYDWDVNQSLSMTNCSNSGRDLLSVWFDGQFVKYKLSVPNMMLFRQARPEQSAAPAVFPSPASTVLQLRGLDETAAYEITDMQGRQVAGGQLRPGTPLDVSGLASGVYTLRASSAAGEPVKLRFTRL